MHKQFTSQHLSQGLKNTILIRSRCSLLICSSVHKTQVLETIHMPSISDRLRGFQYIYTIEYYPAIRKDRGILHYVAGINGVTLSDVSQKEGDKQRIISLTSLYNKHSQAIKGQRHHNWNRIDLSCLTKVGRSLGDIVEKRTHSGDGYEAGIMYAWNYHQQYCKTPYLN